MFVDNFWFVRFFKEKKAFDVYLYFKPMKSRQDFEPRGGLGLSCVDVFIPVYTNLCPSHSVFCMFFPDQISVNSDTTAVTLGAPFGCMDSEKLKF